MSTKTDQPKNCAAAVDMHPIPDAALDDRLGFVGMTGSGKTYGAGTCVERIVANGGRVIIPDPLGVWWGLRQTADGKSPSRHAIVLLGGPHADLPITPNAGAIIGETVAQMRESAIIDLSQFETEAAQRRFMLAFLRALFHCSIGEPVHVVLDEADMWAPERILDKEGEATKLHNIVQTVVRRGRIKGLTSWLITQRPAALSKAVLSQVDGLVAFRLTASQDRKALGLWIEGQADRDSGKALLARLPEKKQGQAVVWLPAHGILADVVFPPKLTYDSSRAPKRGEAQRRIDLKPLNVAALKERLAHIEADVAANDPKALRAEIARLKADKTRPQSVPVDVKAIEAAEMRGWDAGVEAFRQSLTAQGHAVNNAVAAMLAIAVPFKASVRTPGSSSSPPRQTPARVTNGSGGELPKGERACLIAIAQHQDGVRREQLTVLTGYRRSTRNSYIARLRERSYVDQHGDRIVATPAGIAALGGDYEPLPTGSALREHVLERLPEGERRVLELLIARYPDAVERQQIDSATSYQRSSRDAYLQRLGARELVETRGRDGVKAADCLFD
jgi:hypothetical protein